MWKTYHYITKKKKKTLTFEADEWGVKKKKKKEESKAHSPGRSPPGAWWGPGGVSSGPTPTPRPCLVPLLFLDPHSSVTSTIQSFAFQFPFFFFFLQYFSPSLQAILAVQWNKYTTRGEKIGGESERVREESQKGWTDGKLWLTMTAWSSWEVRTSSSGI